MIEATGNEGDLDPLTEDAAVEKRAIPILPVETTVPGSARTDTRATGGRREIGTEVTVELAVKVAEMMATDPHDVIGSFLMIEADVVAVVGIAMVVHLAAGVRGRGVPVPLPKRGNQLLI